MTHPTTHHPTKTTWSERLSCEMEEQHTTTNRNNMSCNTSEMENLNRWSEAVHTYEKFATTGKIQNSQKLGHTNPVAVGPPYHVASYSTESPDARVFRWFEHVRRITGLSTSVLTPFVWESYVAVDYHDCNGGKAHLICAEGGPEQFVSHTTIRHLAATYAAHAGTGQQESINLPNHRWSLYRWLVDPTQLGKCASMLELEIIGLSNTPIGLERAVGIVHKDQHQRFACVREELMHASVSKNSPLHTLYETFSPTAQALGVVEHMLFAVWKKMSHHLLSTHDHHRTHNRMHPHNINGNDSPRTKLYAHFRRKYDDEPVVDVHFREDATYTCTVRHLDGNVLGTHTDAHREIATDYAIKQALLEISGRHSL